MKTNANGNPGTRVNGRGFGVSETDASVSEGNRFDENIVFDAEGLDAPATQPMRQRKGRRRKLIAGTLLLLLLFAGIAITLYFMLGSNRTQLSLRVRDPQAQEGKSQTRQSPEDVTSQAIAELRSATPDVSPSVAPSGTARVSPTAPVTVPIAGLAGTVSQPAIAESGATNQQTEKPINSSVTTGTDAADIAHSNNTSSASRRNPERSIRCAAPAVKDTNKIPSQPPQHKDESIKPVTGTGVVLPAFGSMLPVRSLGVLYTLRSGSLARFELTRDVRGQGWSMKKGTVLVGANRGSEYDRAYIAIVGFIDPESGRLVKLTGDVLGADGGVGLRGRRHSLTSAWSRAFSRIGASAVNVAGLAASGLGKSSVVISDAYGYRVANPITSELSGLISERTNQQQGGFVEVTAGTQGYVMITNLPAEVQGIDALTELSAKDLTERSDVNGVRASTGLSERELSDLLSSGSVEQIRAALPRMTPEMRRVAEAVIKESGN